MLLVSRGADSPANACSSVTVDISKTVVAEPCCNISHAEQDCSCLAVERRALIVPAGAPAESIAMAHPAPVLASSSAVCAASVPSAAPGARSAAVAPVASSVAPPVFSPVASPAASPVSPVASPVSPVASHVALPVASPAASPVASPAASPAASPVSWRTGASSSAAAADYLVSVLPLLAIYLVALLALHQLYLALM
ncbi:hypothetical protein, partial, partial [Parasitella parasitica]